jgi:hypothetical protein
MNKRVKQHIPVMLIMVMLWALSPPRVDAVEDGRGTNYTDSLVIGAALTLGDETRTNWPGDLFTVSMTVSNTLTVVGDITAASNLFMTGSAAYLSTPEVRAADGNGLKLYEDSGTAGLLVDDSGYVGIGGAPAGHLDVDGGTAAGAANGVDISLQAQAGGSGDTDGGDIALLPGAASGTGTAGGVGIGTASPSGMLDINGSLIQKTVTIAADDTTPDISGGSIFLTSANTGATAITDLDNPQPGQVIYLIGGSGTNPSTISDTGNFHLSGEWTATEDDVLILYVKADNDYIELGRVDN